MGDGNGKSRNAWAFLLVGLPALVTRLMHIYETREVPFLRELAGDAAGYYQWAERIAAGEVVGSEPFYQAPFYPYVLGALFAVGGDSVWAIRMVQALWGSAACVFLALAAARLFDRRVGVVAGLMMALYPPAIFFDGIVQKASLDGFLVCILVSLLATMGSDEATKRRSDEGRGALSVGERLVTSSLGIVTGLLCLTRENAFVWLPLIAAWVLVSSYGIRRYPLHGRRRFRPRPLRRFVASSLRRFSLTSRPGWTRLGWYLSGCAVVLAPVALRNRAVSGEWSFSTFQAGPNFFIGNQRGADGRYRPLVKGHETPEFERADATRLAQEAEGRTLSAGEVSRYWLRRALADIRDDPRRWIRLMGRKILMVWNRYEVSDVESQYVYAEYSVLLRVLGTVWHFGVLAPLAALGLVLSWSRWRELWIFPALMGSMTLAVALFFVLARYRFCLVPLLVPFAAAGATGLWSLITHQAIRGRNTIRRPAEPARSPPERKIRAG